MCVTERRGRESGASTSSGLGDGGGKEDGAGLDWARHSFFSTSIPSSHKLGRPSSSLLFPPPRQHPIACSSVEVDWNTLDKRQFVLQSVALFSTISACLFPLTVIKTRCMVSPTPVSSIPGTLRVARDLVKSEGVRGLYRGFGTVVFGTIPARVIYLSTLEQSKLLYKGVLEGFELSETMVAGGQNLLAGGTASAMTQAIIVPVDVISQRQMIASASGSGTLAVARQILKVEGVAGFYRGFSISLLTFVPSSALWWGSYGAYKNVLFSAAAGNLREDVPGFELILQTVASCMAGCTSAFLTNPIDVIKTRLQTSGEKGVSISGTIRSLVTNEGLFGFWRGVFPRMTSTALWGTAMVTGYEFL